MIAGAMQNAKLQSGDPCPEACGGRLYVETSRAFGRVQVQYLRCDGCKQYPEGNKIVKDSEHIRRRRRP